jgi:hypothetical protein
LISASVTAPIIWTLAAAPVNSSQGCVDSAGVESVCRPPGDVEIDSSHPVEFPPLYPDFGARGIYHHGHHHH